MRRLLYAVVIFLFTQSVLSSDALSDFNTKLYANTVYHTDSITKSVTDTCSYRFIEFENGMKVMLVQDLDAENVSVTLSIDVGYLHDPFSSPGLAQIVEKAIWVASTVNPPQGTPTEDSRFLEYLQRNAVSFESKTLRKNTIFCFSMKHEIVLKVLEVIMAVIFSHSFNDADVALLEYIFRDDQHKKTSPFYCYLSSQMKNADKSKRYFSATESQILKTLDRCSISTEIGNFMKQHYRTNRMCVVIRGKAELVGLTLTAGKAFSPLEANLEPVTMSERPIDDSTIEKAEVEAFTTIVRSDEYSMEIKCLIPYVSVKPAVNQCRNLICYLFNSKYSGSLFEILKKNVFVTDLKCGFEIYDESALFKVTVKMTKKGYEKRQIVCQYISEYIRFLTKNVQRLKNFHGECESNDSLRFYYNGTSKPTDFTELCINLSSINPVDILVHSIFYDDYNAETMSYVLSEIKFSKLQHHLIESDTAIEKKSKHKAANVKKSKKNKKPKGNSETFTFENSPDNELKDLSLPVENKFMPRKIFLDVIKGDEANSDKQFDCLIPSRLFYKKDSYASPRVIASIFFEPNDHSIGECAKNRCMLTIFEFYALENVSEKLGHAYDAGFEPKIKCISSNFFIELIGFQDKMEIFLECILNMLLDTNIDKQSFLPYLKSCQENISNLFNESPFKLSDYHLNSILIGKPCLIYQNRKALHEITFESYVDFLQSFLQTYRYNFKMLCNGNIDEEKTRRLFSIAEKIIPLTATTKEQKPSLPTITSKSYENFNFSVQASGRCNSVSISIFVDNLETGQDYGVCSYFVKYFEAAFVDAMISSASPDQEAGLYTDQIYNSMQLIFKYQSATESCEIIESKINDFIQNTCSNFLASLTEKNFNEQKQKLLALINIPAGRVALETDYWSSYLQTGFIQTLSSDKYFSAYKKVTLDDLKTFYREKIQNIAPDSYKISLWLQGDSSQFKSTSTEGRVFIGDN